MLVFIPLGTPSKIKELDENLAPFFIVGQIAGGRSIDDLLADFPYLEREDIVQALRYAAWRSEEREVQLAEA